MGFFLLRLSPTWPHWKLHKLLAPAFQNLLYHPWVQGLPDAFPLSTSNTALGQVSSPTHCLIASEPHQGRQLTLQLLPRVLFPRAAEDMGHILRRTTGQWIHGFLGHLKNLHVQGKASQTRH